MRNFFHKCYKCEFQEILAKITRIQQLCSVFGKLHQKLTKINVNVSPLSMKLRLVFKNHDFRNHFMDLQSLRRTFREDYTVSPLQTHIKMCIFGLNVNKRQKVDIFMIFSWITIMNLQKWAFLVNAINSNFRPNKCEILTSIFAKSWLPWQ